MVGIIALNTMPSISFGYRTIPNDGGLIPWFTASTAWRMAANQGASVAPGIRILGCPLVRQYGRSGEKVVRNNNLDPLSYYMSVVSVSMPEELLERIDEFADEHGYTGRSEVVREASRNLLGEFEDKKLEGRDLMGVVTVVFDYETTSVEEKMMHLRHEHEDIVASNFHSHVGGHHCMELFVLEGSLEEISTFVGKIRATKDTLTIDYSVLPVDDFGPLADMK
jgi:CopG family nickel-responsive transcriptional regulator